MIRISLCLFPLAPVGVMLVQTAVGRSIEKPLVNLLKAIGCWASVSQSPGPQNLRPFFPSLAAKELSTMLMFQQGWPRSTFDDVDVRTGLAPKSFRRY